MPAGPAPPILTPPPPGAVRIYSVDHPVIFWRDVMHVIVFYRGQFVRVLIPHHVQGQGDQRRHNTRKLQ